MTESLGLNPLPIQSKLAQNPSGPLKFPIEVQVDGKTVTLADPRATRVLVALMNQHALIGGAAAHWGGPSAFAEIMSALHGVIFNSENPWYEKFNFVNDAGHCENGLYALRANYGFDGMELEDLKGFRSIDSKLTGHGEAHLNPEQILVSNGPLGSGVAQAQGLALADKLLNNKRLTVCALSDGASMEGEAKEPLASIPGLFAKNKLNPFLLLISDNNTKLSGRIEDDSFSMTPSFKALETLGWDLRPVNDGHNLAEVYKNINQAVADLQNGNRPIALWFKTIKGKGVQSTEEAASGGHGHPLKAYDPKLLSFLEEIYDGNLPETFANWAKDISQEPESDKPIVLQSAVVKKEKIQVGVAKALNELKEQGLPLFSLSSDLQGSTGVKGFHQKFPHSYLDMGVSESNMISTAIGLSLNGFIPIVDTFSQFGVTKGNLPLIMSGLSRGPMIAFFSHTGFQDAADGASHQATTYVSALNGIPDLEMVNLSHSNEAYELVKLGVQQFVRDRSNGKTPKSLIYFLGRENFPSTFTNSTTYQWGKAQELGAGKALTIVTNGSSLIHALKARDLLNNQGHEVTVINNPFITCPDIDLIENSLKNSKGRLITIEDHQIQGGFGQILAAKLSKRDTPFKWYPLGITGKFGQSAYKAEHIYKLYQLDGAGIAEYCAKILQ